MRPSLDHHWERWPTASGVDDHGIGVLDDATCLRLLTNGTIGRLGLTAGALPAILPVNYVVRDDSILFRSADGAKVRAAGQGDVACIQVDDVDLLDHRGWSVLATGRLQLVDAAEAAAMDDLRLVPWALRGEVSLVRLPLELLSGRVF